MPADILTAELNNITGMLASVAALGTAAYGLVDITKVFGGGISNAGFGYILTALTPFKPALVAAGGENWAKTLRAHWLNGMDKDDQKAISKSLIHLGLSPANAAELAVFGHVDPSGLVAVVTKLDAGTDLGPADINLLGRFDAMVDATLDGGFERADQLYRNAAKALAAVFAIALAIGGEAVIAASTASNQIVPAAFIGSKDFWLAFMVGLVSVPLAPIAKDLSTSLTTAVKAMKAAGG
jgi:hypothetical protein